MEADGEARMCLPRRMWLVSLTGHVPTCRRVLPGSQPRRTARAATIWRHEFVSQHQAAAQVWVLRPLPKCSLSGVVIDVWVG